MREFGSKKDIGMSLLWYWISYVVVTWVGIGHTIFNILVLGMKSMAEGPGLGQGYEMTKPWHPLYNIILFTVFGLLYLRKVNNLTLKKAMATGALWAGISIVIDLVGWVLVPHPWSLTFKEFYIDYQPWIALVYLAMFIAPMISYFFISLKNKGQAKKYAEEAANAVEARSEQEYQRMNHLLSMRGKAGTSEALKQLRKNVQERKKIVANPQLRLDAIRLVVCK